MEKEQTFYQELKAKGYTRRQFLKFCGIMGAMLGLHQTGIAQVVNPASRFFGFTFKSVLVAANHSYGRLTRLSDKFCLK